MDRKIKNVIPIYYDAEAHDISFEELPGTVLVTEENYEECCQGGMDDLGRVNFMVFDTPREARIAANATDRQGGVTLVGECFDGSGVVAIVEDDMDPEFATDDARTLPAGDELFGSWELPKEDVLEASKYFTEAVKASSQEGRYAKIVEAELGHKGVQGLQIALQMTVPGAYVGFIEKSLDDVMDLYEVEDTPENRALVHSAIYAAAEEIELDFAHDAVNDEISDRIALLFPGPADPAHWS